MKLYKKIFEEWLLSTDSFEPVVILLKAKNTSLRAYLNKYKGDPSRIIYHMPIDWTDGYWVSLDRQWWEYCQENDLK